MNIRILKCHFLMDSEDFQFICSAFIILFLWLDRSGHGGGDTRQQFQPWSETVVASAEICCAFYFFGGEIENWNTANDKVCKVTHMEGSTGDFRKGIPNTKAQLGWLKQLRHLVINACSWIGLTQPRSRGDSWERGYEEKSSDCCGCIHECRDQNFPKICTIFYITVTFFISNSYGLVSNFHVMSNLGCV